MNYVQYKGLAYLAACCCLTACEYDGGLMTGYVRMNDKNSNQYNK